MKIEIKGWIQAKTLQFAETKIDYCWMQAEDMAIYGYTMVCPHTLAFDLPEGATEASIATAAIEHELAEVGRTYSEHVKRLKDALSKLQAITNEVTA